jgi:hypothetical protein
VGQLTATDTITIELIEADKTPAVVIVKWPVKPTVFTLAGFRLALTTLPISSLVL